MKHSIKLLLIISYLYAVSCLAGCNNLNDNALMKSDIIEKNQPGYELFYSHSNINRDNSWFDAVYDKQIIYMDEDENTRYLLISCVIYPKTREYVQFWCYPEVNSNIKEYAALNFTKNWADENTVDPFTISKAEDYNGFGTDWNIPLKNGATDEEVLELSKNIQLHIVIQNDEGKELERSILALEYSDD